MKNFLKINWIRSQIISIDSDPIVNALINSVEENVIFKINNKDLLENLNLKENVRIIKDQYSKYRADYNDKEYLRNMITFKNIGFDFLHKLLFNIYFDYIQEIIDVQKNQLKDSRGYEFCFGIIFRQTQILKKLNSSNIITILMKFLKIDSKTEECELFLTVLSHLYFTCALENIYSVETKTLKIRSN